MNQKVRTKTQIFEEVSFPVSIGSELELTINNTHHLKDVLRVKNGDFIKIIINCKQEALAELVVNKKQLKAKIITLSDIPQKNHTVKCLCFAICKSAQNELVCEKATELGVEHIVFWRSEHTSIKVNNEKILRLRKIAEGAACQSKQSYLPNISVKDNLVEAIDFAKTFTDPLCLYASLVDTPQYLHEIEELAGTAISIFIGPEGGFSANENILLQQSAKPFSLGDSVLKAETAAIVAIAQVQAFCRCFK